MDEEAPPPMGAGAEEAPLLPPPKPHAPPLPPLPEHAPHAPPVQGGVGLASGPRTGAGPVRRLSAATESTPLFLGGDAGAAHHGPLVFDEGGEKEYGPSRWKATVEATVAKVFWDGFLWERMAFVAARGLGDGPTTPVRGAARTRTRGRCAARCERTSRAARALLTACGALAASRALPLSPAHARNARRQQSPGPVVTVASRSRARRCRSSRHSRTTS
jgi:hypothetical protein